VKINYLNPVELERMDPILTIIKTIGRIIINTTNNERLRPTWCMTLIIFKSINVQSIIIGMITSGAPSNFPEKPNKNKGELIKKITPNWIRKLTATHFILVLSRALVIVNPNFNNKISPPAKAAIRIRSIVPSSRGPPIWNKFNNISISITEEVLFKFDLIEFFSYFKLE